MNINLCQQESEEWWALKVAKISGTRFGQAISTRENRLIYELLDEKLKGYIERDEWESEDMLFGKQNEPIAREKYIEKSGIQFEQVGAIMSDFSDMHMASPDGLSKDGIVLEIKCTSKGAIHIQRFDKGPETQYMSQIINYFSVSDEVKEVHWVSYCPYRLERELVIKIFTRSDFKTEIIKGRYAIKEIEQKLIKLEQSFIF